MHGYRELSVIHVASEGSGGIIWLSRHWQWKPDALIIGRTPWEESLVEVHFGGVNDFPGLRDPHVVGSRDCGHFSQVVASPAVVLNASFRVGGAGLDGEGSAAERHDWEDARPLSRKQFIG
jgi:hypothetical protein